jgi:hypothetical protein
LKGQILCQGKLIAFDSRPIKGHGDLQNRALAKYKRLGFGPIEIGLPKWKKSAVTCCRVAACYYRLTVKKTKKSTLREVTEYEQF